MSVKARQGLNMVNCDGGDLIVALATPNTTSMGEGGLEILRGTLPLITLDTQTPPNAGSVPASYGSRFVGVPTPSHVGLT